MENKYSLYKQLTNMDGIAGYEKKIKRFVKSQMEQYTNEILEDGLGGVFGVLEGEGPTIMICAHMDEVGFMVKNITSSGMIRLLPIGGMNPDVYLSQNMHVTLDNGEVIRGVIGALPPHLSKTKVENTFDNMLLDLGFSSYDEAYNAGIRIGQQVVSDNNFYFTKDQKKIVSKAIDDRFGVGMVLELLKEASKMKHNNRLVFGATVQEEVGTRGARVASSMIKPDLFITIDVSPTDDFVQQAPLANACLGKGFLIRYFDPSIIMNRDLHDYFVDVATKNNIDYQEYKANGGTDAAIAQYASNGTLATTIGLPGRYIHTTAAMVNVDDMESVKKMALKVIETFNNQTLKRIKEGYND